MVEPSAAGVEVPVQTDDHHKQAAVVAEVAATQPSGWPAAPLDNAADLEPCRASSEESAVVPLNRRAAATKFE